MGIRRKIASTRQVLESLALLFISCQKLHGPLPKLLLLLLIIAVNTGLDRLPNLIVHTTCLGILGRNPSKICPRFLWTMDIVVDHSPQKGHQSWQDTQPEKPKQWSRLPRQPRPRHETRVEGHDGPLLVQCQYPSMQRVRPQDIAQFGRGVTLATGVVESACRDR